MTLADAVHALAITGCRLSTGQDGGIVLDVPPGAQVARDVLDVLRAHRDQIASLAAPAPPPADDLAEYLTSKSISGAAAELVLHAAATFEVRHDRITVEADAAEPSPTFFEPGIPCITTIDTEWHEARRGLFTIPAGTLALAIPQTWAIADDEERVRIEAALDSIRRQKRPVHVPVWMHDKARAIDANSITFDQAVAPDGMNLIPWRPHHPGEHRP